MNKISLSILLIFCMQSFSGLGIPLPERDIKMKKTIQSQPFYLFTCCQLVDLTIPNYKNSIYAEVAKAEVAKSVAKSKVATLKKRVNDGDCNRPSLG